MKRKLGKCLCSMLLALAMVIGLLPGMGMTVYAAMDQNKTFKAGDMIHSGFPMEWIRFGDENNTRKQVDDCTIQSITYNETSGKWVVSIPTVPWEDPLSLSYPSQTGKVFVGLKWASTSGNPVTNGYYQLAAVYEDAPTVTVTYSVVNGTWSDGTTADKTETVQSGSAPASVPSGMIAGSGFTGGSWDTEPASATITGDTTFTYTFEAIPTYTVTYSVVNGTWSDGTTADKTETVVSGASPASIPSGMIASSGYTGGAWDTDPSGATITGDTTYTYTFTAVPTYTVTYSVVNGTWSDGTTADKTETVASGLSPASIPSGMIASSGYTGGTWDTDPSGATITGNTTYTYTFTAVPTYTVTYSVVNGTWADGTTADKTETVASGASPASIPAGMIASSGYTGGAWDTDPSGATITGDTTYTYTFTAVPTYTVTYSVVNGSWADGTTADKTETVVSGASPASIPTGMIASSGYTGGSWDTAPASATITGDKTFTYAFEAVPVYYTVAGGSNSTFTIGDASDLVITVKRNVADDACFSHFIGIEIDGKALVSGTDYTAVAGSTVVTIKAATLNRLSAGGHTITIVFDDGKIETSVTAKAASGTSNGGSAVPSTGESLAPTLFIGIAFVAVAGTLFTVMLVQKKRKSVR